MLETIRQIQPLVKAVRRHDRNLSDQIRRAATSVALNLAEADGSDAGNAVARLHTARGSLHETRAALAIAKAWRYVDDVTALDGALDRVAAMLHRRLAALQR